jgi:DNA-directed RNA polymerase specialized sigma24 family protein
LQFACINFIRQELGRNKYVRFKGAEPKDYSRQYYSLDNPSDENGGTYKDLLRCDRKTPDEACAEMEGMRHFGQALEALPTDMRLCVEQLLEGKRYKEVAQGVGLSTSRVEQLVKGYVRHKGSNKGKRVPGAYSMMRQWFENHRVTFADLCS